MHKNKQNIVSKLVAITKINLFSIVLIVIGVLIFYWVKDYKKVPSGIGPDFFPKIVASMLIGFSVVNILIQKDNKNASEFTVKKGSEAKIAFTSILLISSVLIMMHVHFSVGMLLFLLGYLKILAKLEWKHVIIISVLGSIGMSLAALLLRIPM